jgi:hypothetical protein
VVVIPLVVNINGTVFDPTAPNYCGLKEASTRLPESCNRRLWKPGPLTFNGIDVGDVQYVDGFMRAQFWQTINGNPAYRNEFSFSVAPSVTINAGTNGSPLSEWVSTAGILDQSFVHNQILSLLQSLTGISTSEIVLFVTNNVALPAANSPPAPPATALGYHAVTGSAPQVYAVADYNTTGLLKARNTTVVSHELAEIMNDPLIYKCHARLGRHWRSPRRFMPEHSGSGGPVGRYAGCHLPEWLHLQSGGTRVLQLVLQRPDDSVSRRQWRLFLERTRSRDLRWRVRTAERSESGTRFAPQIPMTVARQISQYARGRILRRLARSMPWIGAVVAIAAVGTAVRSKGLFGGVVDTALDAVPGVGAVKNAIEAVRGRDFIRDKRAYSRRSDSET